MLLVPLVKRLVQLRGLLLKATQGVVADAEVMGAAVGSGGKKGATIGWGEDEDDGMGEAPGVKGRKAGGGGHGHGLASASGAATAEELGMGTEGLAEAVPALR